MKTIIKLMSFVVFAGTMFSSCLLLSIFSGNGSNDAEKPSNHTSGYTTVSTSFMQEIVNEHNFVRTNPKKYAREVLQPMLKKFNGTLYDNYLRTNEGASAVHECIAVLNTTAPMGTLSLEKGLCLSAQWLADDQANTGRTGHDGSNGSNPFTRMNYFGKWYITAAENCAYGARTAREIVARLLIDDGVYSRGHRINILNPQLKKVGVGFSTKNNAPYGAVTVLDYAGDYKSN